MYLGLPMTLCPLKLASGCYEVARVGRRRCYNLVRLSVPASVVVLLQLGACLHTMPRDRSKCSRREAGMQN